MESECHDRALVALRSACRVACARWLQVAVDNALHALSCGAAHNILWLLRAIVRLDSKVVFLRLFRAAADATSGVKSLSGSRLTPFVRLLPTQLTSVTHAAVT